MGMLHELLAVEGDLEGVYKKVLDEAKVTFDKKEDHFVGFHRKLEMFEDDGVEYPEESKELVTTVHDKLDYIADHAIRYFDAVLQKEKTNQEARANLEVDGVVLAYDVPATFLLGLENKLKVIRGVYEATPTLIPGIKWEKDTTKGEHVYVTAKPEEKLKTAKTFQHKVLYEATDKHPAQIEKWEETISVGKFVRTIWSGMISPHEKSVILGRIDKLIQATKKARQKANSTTVIDTTIGREIFDYINGE